jgi:wobble nucleotide-excising tRNase
VIFDDPMTSFDYERRRKTIHHITDISSQVPAADGSMTIIYPRQKIVLTHEHGFARELNRLVGDAVTLKISDLIDDGIKRSKIVHADFTKDFPEDDISDRIENIAEVFAKRKFDVNFELDCRVVLEHIFKRKYHLELKDNIANRKSVRTFTTTLSEAKINGFDDVTKRNLFIRLCDDLNIEMHDGSVSSSNGDKESIIKDFFVCLKTI